MNDTTEPRTLFHYTSFAALSGILQDRAVWATDIRFLNDATEFSYTQLLLAEAIDETLKAGASGREKEALEVLRVAFTGQMDPAAYVFSLSQMPPDNLSQWRGYAQGSGVAIGFRLPLLRVSAESHGFKLVKCIYDLQEQNLRLKNFVRNSVATLLCAPSSVVSQESVESFQQVTLANQIGPEFLSLATCMKDPGFVDEKEWRFVCVRSSPPSRLHVRAGKSILIPYTTIPIYERRNHEIPPDCYPQLLVIDEIMTGPNVHSRDLLYQSITSAYRAAGFSWRHFSSSSIPYRPNV